MRSDTLNIIFLFIGLSSLSTGIANSTPEALQYSVFGWFYFENPLFASVGLMIYHYGCILLAAYFINLAFRD